MNRLLKIARGFVSNPSIDVLTLDGNQIDDIKRAAATEGDGRGKYDFSMGVWEATTNLITNGGFETNKTGWTDFNGTTSTRITTDSKFGSACLELVQVDDPADSGTGILIDPGANDDFVFSAWVRIVSGSPTGAQWRLRGHRNSDSLDLTTFPFTPTAEWQRFSMPITITGSGQAYTWRVEAPAAQVGNSTLHVDGIDLVQLPYPAPYIETDGSSASRGAVVISGENRSKSLFTETQGWLALRVRMGWDSTITPTDNKIAFGWADNSDNFVLLFFENTADEWAFNRKQGAGQEDTHRIAASWSQGDEITLVYPWTATTVGGSVDGSAIGTTSSTFIPTLTDETFNICMDPNFTTPQLNAECMAFACGKGLLTDADASRIHNLLSVDPTNRKPSDFPGECTGFWNGKDKTFMKAP